MFGFKSIRDEKVFWNTGCWYTEHGQRMGAYWDGTYIHYVDIDRGCNGSFRCTTVDDEYYLKQYVQLIYDRPLGHRHILLSCDERDLFEAEVEEKAPSRKEEHDKLMENRK